MSIYLQLPIVALIVAYCVDVSGFTESWRNLLARWLGLHSGEDLRPLPPFDCGKCATWWTCLIYALCAGEFSLLTIAEAAMLSCLSDTIGLLLLFIHEALGWLIDKITPR